MSLENAKRFIDAASKDQALQKELDAAREPAEAVRLAVQAGSERAFRSRPKNSWRFSVRLPATAAVSSATVSSNLSAVALAEG